MQLQKISSTGTKTKITAPAAVFSVEKNDQILSQAIYVARSNKRQGTSKVKTRAEVSLTKKKAYKQKGTGNARHGAKSAPIFVGGGVAHGPTGLQNWNRSFPQPLKRQALAQALTVQSEHVRIADQLDSLTGKTKDAVKSLNIIAPKSDRILIVLDKNNPTVLRALRNIPTVTTISASMLSALDVLSASAIIFTTNSLAVVTERITGKKITPEKKSVAKKIAKPTITTKKTVTKKKTKPTATTATKIETKKK